MSAGTSTAKLESALNSSLLLRSFGVRRNFSSRRRTKTVLVTLGRVPMNTTQGAVPTLVAGLGLLIPASIGLLGSGTPTMLSPFPALTVLPAFLFGKAAVAVPTLLFFAWHPGLFRGEPRIPTRSYALFIVVAILSVIYFVESWKWGLEYQGSRFTHLVCIVNVACVASIGLAFARSWKGASTFKYSLFLHWILFAWLAWCAFPYLGELP
jgi:hypothetical protein